ncbi:hypothetical protein [Arenimonas oryziterrae]|uniref:Uncharacterized protein n=1 Tax=Arenimonas oryziterrae DSM 21050 = YC6267 TaxID=1121015 RepID=A0A091BGM7_9GAMM|nr:hypothetical protein [Arenimonas oryziterrae]KFN43500.1 hypothetical protein N789_09505 [Arenimonas oryziterrae DSM 21050 = YC6267]
MTETDLRWQLRQLPRDIEPSHDLWPGIAERIAAPRRRATPPRWLSGLAIAASLALAVGLAWRVAPTPGTTATPTPDFRASLVKREAQAMTIEYESALRQFDGAPLPEALSADLHTLDHSAAQIRHAIASDPDAVYLLQQLRKTYSRRLALTQRAAIG